MNIKEFWRAVLAQDEKEIRKYFSDKAYINWHCTNEHFNLDEYIVANCEYPGEWDEYYADDGPAPKWRREKNISTPIW